MLIGHTCLLFLTLRHSLSSCFQSLDSPRTPIVHQRAATMSTDSQQSAAANADASACSVPSSPSAAAIPVVVAALVCSKDRAWQLDQMLCSLMPDQSDASPSAPAAAASISSSSPRATPSNLTAAEFDVTIIFTSSSAAHAHSYEQVKRKWPRVHFQREEDEWTPPADRNMGAAASMPTAASAASSAAPTITPPPSTSTAFASHCFSALRRWSSLRSTPGGSPLISGVLLCVDDMLFLRADVEPPPWAQLCALLAQQPALLSVQLALHPRLDWCHPASQPAQPPMLMFPQPLPELAGTTDGGSQPSATAAVATAAAAAPSLPLPPSAAASLSPSSLLRFVRLLGSRDWNYPISLCGGLYRLSDVALLLHQMERIFGGRAAFSHPNKLELLANRAAQSGAKAKGALSAEEQKRAAAAAAAAAAGSDADEHFLPSDWDSCSAVPLAAHRPWSACFSHPALVVVTVNRVQDVFANPVYGGASSSLGGDGTGADASAVADGPTVPSASASTASAQPAPAVGAPGPLSSAAPTAAAPVIDDLSADDLLRLWQRDPSLAFDLPRYRAVAHTFRSVHIGQFIVRRDGSSQR